MSTRYWIGGTGNWSDGAHWSATSGGATDNTVPTSADDVHFDAGSNTTNAAYTVTVNATANCKDLMFDAKPGDGLGGTITLAGTAALNIYGSLLLLSGMTRTYTGLFTFSATTTGKTITSNGVSTYDVSFNGVGGGWTQADGLTISHAFDGRAGTWNTGGFPLITNQIQILGASTKALNLGASAMTITGGSYGFYVAGSGHTVDAGTSTITFTGTALHMSTFFGVVLYDIVTVPPNNAPADAISCRNLTINGTATKTGSLPLAANITCSGTLTITGNSATNRILLQSNTLGTSRTITAAAVALSNCDFMDITGAGAAAPFTGTSLGNCLGNSGITFTPAADQYWYKATGSGLNYSAVGNWYLGSGGTGGAGRVPLPQDNVIFNSASFGAAGMSIYFDMPRSGKDVTLTGVTNTPAFAHNGTNWEIYGSLTLASPIWANYWSPGTQLRGRGAHTVTSAGNTFINVASMYAYGGSYTLADAASFGSNFVVYAGTFADSGYSLTSAAQITLLGALPITLNKSGTWTFTSANVASYFNNAGSAVTINDTGGSFKFTDSIASTKGFYGGGKTYNNIWMNSPSTLQITGSNTFNTFKADPGAIVQFTAGTTQTAASYTIDGRASTGTDGACGATFGTTNHAFTTPNAAGSTLTGDMSYVFSGKLSSIASSAQGLGSQGDAAGQRNWELYEGGGYLNFRYTTNGTTQISKQSTVTLASIGAVAGGFMHFAVYQDVDNGAGGSDVKFYYSTDGSTWTQMGTTVTTAGTITRFNSTSQLRAFSLEGGQWVPTGLLCRARLYSGDFQSGGTLVADFNSAHWSSGSTFTAATGEVWTRNGNAQFTGTNLVTIMSATNATHTLAVTGAAFDPKFVSYRNSIWTAAKNTSHYSQDGGSNTNVTFTPARYAVAASASVNWNTTASWSLSSGGPSGAAIPTSADDVCWDNRTYPTAYTFTVDATANCRDMLFGAAPATSGTITWAGSAALNVYGSLLLLSGMTRSYTGVFTFKATTTGKTITSNAVSLIGLNFYFNGVGGGWTLQDNCDLGAGGGSPIFNNGSVDLNGKTLTGYIWQLNGGSLTFNGGVANAKYWQCAAGMTIADATGTINILEGYFTGAGKSYGSLVMAALGGSAAYITGANTFVNLTRVGNNVKTDTLQLYANQTVTGTLTLTGNSATNRLLVQSDTLGTSRTITAAAVALTNCDFMDITGAGAAAPFTGTSLGNALGNSGITFTTAADQYWYTTTTGTKTWSTAGNWFLGSGGTGGAGRVPLPQDNVIFNASSIGAASTLIQPDMPRMGKDINWTGVTNTPTWSATGLQNYLYGSLTFSTPVTLSTGSALTMHFYTRSAATWTPAGNSMPWGFVISAFGGSVTLGSALTMGIYPLTLSNGTFNDGGYNVTWTGNFSAAAGALIRSGLWTFGGTTYVFSSGVTLTDTGTLKFTEATSAIKYFQGGGKTYGTLWFSGAGSGSYQWNVTGNNTITELKVDNLPKDIRFTAATNTTIGSFTNADVPAASKFARLNGVSGSAFSTPNAAGSTPTGDMSVVAEVTPLSLTATLYLLVQYQASGTNTNYDFLFGGGTLAFRYSTTGANLVSKSASVTLASVGLAAGQHFWVGVLHDVDNGAGGNDVKFYYSTNGTSWNQLGATQTTAGAVTRFASTYQLEAFGGQGGVLVFQGDGHRARLYSGDFQSGGTLVADFNPNDWTSGNTWTSSTTGEVWTRTGSALIYPEIKISSITAATHTLTKSGGGIVDAGRNGNITYSIASPAATFYAGAAGTNGGNNTNWVFNNVPATATASLLEIGHYLSSASSVLITADASLLETETELSAVVAVGLAAQILLTEANIDVSAAAAAAIAAAVSCTDASELEAACSVAIDAAAEIINASDYSVSVGIYWIPSADRRYIVAAESRAYAGLPESRTYTVAAESRTYTIAL